MAEDKSGRELVEALISEAQRIVAAHCNPDNPSGFLTRTQKQDTCRKLFGLNFEVNARLRPRIGHVQADDLRVGLSQRLNNLLDYADAETHHDPDRPQQRKEARLEHLRYELRTTDLPLIYDALRDACGSKERVPEIEGFRSADWLWHQHGIKQSRLSEAARDNRVSTRRALAGTLDLQGRTVRILYNEAEAIKHCSPKRVTAKTRRKFGRDNS